MFVCRTEPILRIFLCIMRLYTFRLFCVCQHFCLHVYISWSIRMSAYTSLSVFLYIACLLPDVFELFSYFSVSSLVPCGVYRYVAVLFSWCFCLFCFVLFLVWWGFLFVWLVFFCCCCCFFGGLWVLFFFCCFVLFVCFCCCCCCILASEKFLIGLQNQACCPELPKITRYKTTLYYYYYHYYYYHYSGHIYWSGHYDCLTLRFAQLQNVTHRYDSNCTVRDYNINTEHNEGITCMYCTEILRAGRSKEVS